MARKPALIVARVMCLLYRGLRSQPTFITIQMECGLANRKYYHVEFCGHAWKDVFCVHSHHKTMCILSTCISFCCCFTCFLFFSFYKSCYLLSCLRCGSTEWGKTTVYVMRMQIESRQTKQQQRNACKSNETNWSESRICQYGNNFAVCKHQQRRTSSIDRFIWTNFRSIFFSSTENK